MSEAAQPPLKGLPAHPLLVQTPDIRHAVRRLRWFTASFRSETSELAAVTEVRYRIDDVRLAETFVAWLHAFRAQHEDAYRDRRDFALFAAGLMLRELIRHQPISEAILPHEADPANPAHYWPEGYAYVAYCLTVFASVMRQEFAETVAFHRDLADVRVWSTFRDNATDDPSLAIAFLDHFSGARPNWSVPSLFTARSSGAAPQIAADRTHRRAD